VTLTQPVVALIQRDPPHLEGFPPAEIAFQTVALRHGPSLARYDPRMSHRDAPESLAGLVPKVLEEVGLSEASLGMRLLRVWDEALGPELAPHCRPEGIRRGVIQARVADSAWMQRLQMEKPGILRGLRKALEEEEIDLRLRIGALEERPGGA
jgi:hypothetical protein